MGKWFSVLGCKFCLFHWLQPRRLDTNQWSPPSTVLPCTLWLPWSHCLQDWDLTNHFPATYSNLLPTVQGIFFPASRGFCLLVFLWRYLSLHLCGWGLKFLLDSMTETDMENWRHRSSNSFYVFFDVHWKSSAWGAYVAAAMKCKASVDESVATHPPKNWQACGGPLTILRTVWWWNLYHLDPRRPQQTHKCRKYNQGLSRTYKDTIGLNFPGNDCRWCICWDCWKTNSKRVQKDGCYFLHTFPLVIKHVVQRLLKCSFEINLSLLSKWTLTKGQLIKRLQLTW